MMGWIFKHGEYHDLVLEDFLAAMSRQISIILALAAYENDRKSTSSSVGSWESLINPLQIMLFFIGIRIGFRYLLSGGSLGGSATSLYFNVVIFMAAGFTIYFPFRQLAIQALSGFEAEVSFVLQTRRASGHTSGFVD